MKEQAPAFQVDPLRLASRSRCRDAKRSIGHRRGSRSGPVLVYATADAATVKGVQKELGAARAGALVESALAAIASRLVDAGVTAIDRGRRRNGGRRGGALRVAGLRIGAEIDPGVPWTVTLGERPLALALKSGNFGSDDFFLKAWSRLP